MKNLIRFGAIVPIAGMSLLALTSGAKAALVSFSPTGSQFNFQVGFQINQSALGDPVVSGDQLGNAGDSKGFNNFHADFLFTPTLPALIDTVFTGSNAVLDNVPADASNPFVPSYCGLINGEAAVTDAQIGECSTFTAVAGNLGAFAGLPNGTVGYIRNADGAPTTLTNFTYNTPFVSIVTAPSDPNGRRRFDFTLSSATAAIQPNSNPTNNPSAGLIPGNTNPFLGVVDVLLQGGGTVRQSQLVAGSVTAANPLGIIDDTVSPIYGAYSYSQTVQGVRDDGRGSDPLAADFKLGPTSSSVSLIVTPTQVPEPSAMAGLLVLAGLGLGSLVKRN